MLLNRQAMAQKLTIPSAELCTGTQLAYPSAMGHIPEDSALMLRYLLRLSRHPATAEDVFQDVWGKIIKARANYRPTAKFTTFMYRVAHNCFIDHIRRNKRHIHNNEFEPELHADTSESPDTIAERSLAKERLSKALLELPEEQRDVFLLHEEAGLNIDQTVGKLRIAIQEPQ
jgi:RNA polymerase sigma-70 factor (ECF subfamily)